MVTLVPNAAMSDFDAGACIVSVRLAELSFTSANVIFEISQYDFPVFSFLKFKKKFRKKD